MPEQPHRHQWSRYAWLPVAAVLLASCGEDYPPFDEPAWRADITAVLGDQPASWSELYDSQASICDSPTDQFRLTLAMARDSGMRMYDVTVIGVRHICPGRMAEIPNWASMSPVPD